MKHVPKGKLYTCFIDFKKAFDSVWRDGLFYKLLQYSIGGKFYDLIKNHYSKTKCSIEVSDESRKGVRQGCILSPMLFLPNGSHLSGLLYADDLVLISQSDEGLENALSILSEYCEHCLLSVNPKKTEIMIFEKKYRKSTLNKHCFHINRHNTEIVNSYTYLGINFSSHRNFKVCKSNLRYQDIKIR